MIELVHPELNDLLSELRVFFEKLFDTDIGLFWIRGDWMRWQWRFVDACGLCFIKGRLFFEMRVWRPWRLGVLLAVAV